MVANMESVLPYIFIIVKGALVTVEISILALIFSVVIGVAVGMLSASGSSICYSLTRIYVELVRSVPLLVLIFLAYYAVPVFSGINLSPYETATGALSIYGGSYMAEVIRSGIASVERSQWEAARSLGFRYWRIMALIVFPQALRVIIPAAVGIFVDLIKGSSVASIIGFVELMHTAINVRNAIFSLSPIVLAGVLYFAICFGLSRLGAHFEARIGWRTRLVR
jgi:His/Glu/Gln/Arg/opine family amino acid ABC transporter permease subunit